MQRFSPHFTVPKDSSERSVLGKAARSSFGGPICSYVITIH